jgi:hypothetical protein
MKLRLETSHEIKLRATPENGDTWEASAFIQPHIQVNCPALWDWLKDRFIQTDEASTTTTTNQQERG